MKKIFLHFLFFLGLVFSQSVFAEKVLVENIFSDIDANYEYRDELQELYDRGMIVPDASGKFNPDSYLQRDEFVGIVMEVICKRCIQPHTQSEFIQKYYGRKTYFDVLEKNDYYYCIELADEEDTVRGYDAGETCQDGTSVLGQRPFCPKNQIYLEEAIAVLLRNSGIFTISDNNEVIQDIYSGKVTKTLGKDVKPKDAAGQPYTFYGYIQKALEFEMTEYDEKGNKQVLKLLELDEKGNVNPKKYVTKEEFLRMSYIALKSNSCSEIEGTSLALKMEILEKTCTPGDEDCQLSDLEDPEDTYDFRPVVDGVCPAGIEDPSGYIWRFENQDSGEQIIRYGKYIDNYTFLTDGEWRVYLRVIDNCGNTGEVYSTIVVGDPVKQEIDVDIDVYDDSCRSPGIGCSEIEFYSEEDDGDYVYDFKGNVSTTCNVGQIEYKWTLTHIETGKTFYYQGIFIDNFLFSLYGDWKIQLRVTDGCGQTGSEQMTYTLSPNPPSTPDPGVIVLPPVCDEESENCYMCEDGKCEVCEGAGCLECPSGNPECNVCEGEDCETCIGENCKKCNEEGDICDITEPPCNPVTENCDSCSNPGITFYSWVLTNENTGQKYTRTGRYINDFEFSTAGRWRIELTKRNGCGESKVTRYINIGNKGVIVLPPVCDEKNENCYMCEDGKCEVCEGAGCLECSSGNPECNVCEGEDCETCIGENCKKCNEAGDTCDITEPPCNPVTENCDSCSNPGITFYSWVLTNENTGQKYTRTGRYINDFEFSTAGRWRIELTKRNGCGESKVTRYINIGQKDPYIDVDIDVFDDDCKSPGNDCTEIEFDEEDDDDNTYDFDVDVETSCSAGIKSYSWKISRENSSEYYTFSSEFIENFTFPHPGVWLIEVTAVDNCGQTGREQMYYVLDNADNFLSVGIIANPIYGPSNLLVDFEGIVSGGVPPYSYRWDFADRSEYGYGRDIQHLFTAEGFYEVVLRVRDSQGNYGYASVIIGVTQGECTMDTDGDGVIDCNDLCPNVFGDVDNFGCPVVERRCDVSCGCPDGYICGNQNPESCSTGVCEPIVPTTSSCLFQIGQTSIFGSPVCTTCPCAVSFDFIADIRKCDILFPAITSPDGKEIYSRGNTWQLTK